MFLKRGETTDDYNPLDAPLQDAAQKIEINTRYTMTELNLNANTFKEGNGKEALHRKRMLVQRHLRLLPRHANGNQEEATDQKQDT